MRHCDVYIVCQESHAGIPENPLPFNQMARESNYLQNQNQLVVSISIIIVINIIIVVNIVIQIFLVIVIDIVVIITPLPTHDLIHWRICLPYIPNLAATPQPIHI